MIWFTALLAATVYTTPVADRPDEPIANVALPADWKLFPFVESEPKPALTETERKRGFLAYARPINAPVFRLTHPRADERIRRFDVFAARGERVEIDFAVFAGQRLEALQAQATLPFECELRQITYSPNRLSRYTDVGQARERPAYLVPAARSSLAEGENLRYVLTFGVPDDAAAGDYDGEVVISHGGLAEPFRLPIALKVLPFALSRDPAKTYTAYASNKYDLRRMVEYGFTTLPTVYLDYDTSADRIEVRKIDEKLAAWKSFGGQKPTRLIALMNVNAMLYRKYMGKMPVKRPKADMPPDAFFEHLERISRDFLKDWNSRGLPQLFVIGADEPEPSNMEYVQRLYRALKSAGYNTYVTSWTDNHDAYAPIEPYVDAYCEQLHQDSAELAASKKREHWCYPNHNAFELKNAALQSRGGRMTYGFGFWRSADSVLIPWAWSWTFDYDKVPGLSPGCQKLKSDGTEWIEWEWESFVAGAIDEAYVYTLQEAIFRRDGAHADSELSKAIAAGRGLLQRLRGETPFRRRYLADNHWTDYKFDAARLELADAICALKRFPETRSGTCPSVLPGLVDTEEKGVDLSSPEFKGLLRRRVISPTKCYPIEPGVKIKRLAADTVGADVSIDRENGNVNGYKCTTPSIGFAFDPRVDLAQYGYVTYKIRLKSNRDADRAAYWPYQLLFSSRAADGRNLNAALDAPSALPPDVWHECTFPISAISLPQEVRGKVENMRFYFKERDYETGDELHVEIKDLAFIGSRLPVLTRLEVSPARLGARRIAYECDLFGLAGGAGIPVRLAIENSKGETVCRGNTELSRASSRRFLRLPESLPAGTYSVRLELMDGNDAYQSAKEDFLVTRF